ncbi:MAG: MoaD/ThiS family protein [Anaerosomatales bacterium]|nr:MoaD/ThiS family protein [Coriobacteriia bacterium]
MPVTSSVTVRTIAFLDAFQKERGRPSTIKVHVPASGMSASELATELGLPLDRVEGVFLNHVISGLDAMVHPGDRVTFVPHGTPASHPAFFGPFITRRG